MMDLIISCRSTDLEAFGVAGWPAAGCAALSLFDPAAQRGNLVR